MARALVRTLAPLGVLVGCCVSFALSSAEDAAASAPSSRAGRHVARGNSPGRAVREGALPKPIDHAACPAEMALVDSRFCVCRFAASCSHLRADFRRVMQPPVLQPHAATSERG
jgi:hypothetical protein